MAKKSDKDTDSKSTTSSSSTSTKKTPEWKGPSPGKREKFPGIKGIHAPADWDEKKIRQMVKAHPQLERYFKNL